MTPEMTPEDTLKTVENWMRITIASAKKLCDEANMQNTISREAAVAIIAKEIFRYTYLPPTPSPY